MITSLQIIPLENVQLSLLEVIAGRVQILDETGVHQVLGEDPEVDLGEVHLGSISVGRLSLDPHNVLTHGRGEESRHQECDHKSSRGAEVRHGDE